jgi:hypothetical protein
MRFFFVVLSLISVVIAADDPELRVDRPVPPAPGWKFLYNSNVTLGYYIPLGAGAVQNTTRNILPIQGGQFEGPDGLTGEISHLEQRQVNDEHTV